eukprot:TRINITY_DN3121_c0_g2_i1.p1 TRINITY_DN3121_c0_g2~~TRINITY_DN3121_c0_g2_i1.p1  ORF type:complete len:338 (+),score=50.64 TRINITY_DN3121_c0_g2_i1:185-1198(+)
MFQKEDQELVRFLPFIGLLALSAVLSLLPDLLVGRAVDHPGFLAPMITVSSLAAVVMSFFAFRSPSVRRLVAYHAVKFLALSIDATLPMMSFFIKGHIDDPYSPLSPVFILLRVTMALISGLGIALVFTSLANQLKQNKAGDYFRISVDSQPTQGFYGMMRHPILCGVLLIVFAGTVFGGNPGFVAACVWSSIVAFFSIRNEDAAKLRCGNDAVVQYIQQTPRMWPTRVGWTNYLRGRSVGRGIPMPLAAADAGQETSADPCAPTDVVFDVRRSADHETPAVSRATLDQVVVALERLSTPSADSPEKQTPNPRSARSPRSPYDTTRSPRSPYDVTFD